MKGTTRSGGRRGPHRTKREGRALRAAWPCLLLAAAVTACGRLEPDEVPGVDAAGRGQPADAAEAEPVYSNIAVMGENYLPYNLSRFTITDAYGNRAGGGGDNPPGAGGGSTSCCYSLRGTKFKVAWEYYDVDEWHRGNEITYHAESDVEYRPEGPSSGPGSVLAVHIFPDRHVELQYPSKMMAPSRIPIFEVGRWIYHEKPEVEATFSSPGKGTRTIGRIVTDAWLKYRIVDQGDMEQYTYRALTIGEGFDRFPAMQEALVKAKDEPGAFKRLSENLTMRQVEAMKRFVRQQGKASSPAKAPEKKGEAI
jgi:hypothetical protein